MERQVKTRSVEDNNIPNNYKQSVLNRHLQLDHREETEVPQFKMTVLKSHRSALDRQITEAIKINRTQRNKLMNNKTEWGHNKIVRMGMTYE